jgi:hypothetical protein
VSSLKKYEQVLIKLATLIQNGAIVSKLIISKKTEELKINLSPEEEKELFLFYSLLFRKIKEEGNTTPEKRHEIILQLLYPENKKEDVTVTDIPIDLQIDLAIKELTEKKPTKENGHILVNNIAEKYTLTDNDKIKLKNFCRSLISKKEDILIKGDINEAFHIVQEIFMKDPLNINTKKLEDVANKMNVDLMELIKLWNKNSSVLAEKRRKTQII